MDERTSDSGRIHGWKAISRHLDVSVRTAQQWERTQGLPVRRTGGRRGSVYALTGELDAWARREFYELDLGRKQRASERRRTRSALLGAAALALAAIALLVAGSRMDSRAAEVRIASDGLLGVDDQGRICWRLPLPEAQSGQGLDTAKSKAVRLDVDGDGRNEYLVLASHSRAVLSGGAEDERHAMILVEDDGRVRWSKAPSCRILDSRAEPFPDQWHILALTWSRQGGRDRVWLGLGHVLRFPGVVAELGADGSLKPVFVNHGHVNSLEVVEAAGKRWLLAGGATNALRGAFLALLDPERGLALAPEGGPERYRIRMAPAGNPEVYYVLPSIDLTGALGSDVNCVDSIQAGSGGVARMSVAGNPGCSVYVEFDEPLRPRVARIAAACEMLHRRYEKEGVLNHPFQACRDLQQPLPLRRWSPGQGWTETPVPLATMSNVL